MTTNGPSTLLKGWRLRGASVGILVALVSSGAEVPLRSQQAVGSTDFVILKANDVTPSTVRLSIIVVATKEEADAVHRKLESRASFEGLASQYSQHPSAVVGGEFGVFPMADLQSEFRAALSGVPAGGFSPVVAVARRSVSSDWPEMLPMPGTPLMEVERSLGRSYSAATLPADSQSTMTELTYSFGARLRIHEKRGLGFVEITPPWKSSIFGIRPDDPLPSSLLDLFPRTGRFIRGVYVAVPSHPNWFVDVDDRVDAVSRLLYADRSISGDIPGLPKSH